MSIKTEFEKAHKESWEGVNSLDENAGLEVALWAARWAMARCAKMADELRRLNTNPDELAHDIRQLAKDLE